MDLIHSIIACAVTLLLTLVTCGEASGCSYQYKLQPSRSTQNCSLDGYSDQELELQCQVSGSTNFTIEWHHNVNPPVLHEANSIATVIEPALYSNVKIDQENLGTGGAFDRVSRLTLSVYNTELFDQDYLIDGYYWCSINSNVANTNTALDNPSQVVHISSQCFLEGDLTNLTKCTSSVIFLFEPPSSPRCADFSNTSVDIVDAWDSDLCQFFEPPTTPPQPMTVKSTENNDIIPSSTDNVNDISDSTMYTSTTANNQEVSNSDQSTNSPSTDVPMHVIWIAVGIAFAILLLIITIMVVAIVYLTHKKNKIKVSSSPPLNVHNPYIEYGNPTDSLKKGTFTIGAMGHEGTNGVEMQYATLTNVIHSQNMTFGGNGSPDSSTSLKNMPATGGTRDTPLSPLGEYEDVSHLVAARDSSRTPAQRNQYETIENEGPPEYSHLQHAHGGGSLRRQFSTKSTGSLPRLPPPPPPSTQSTTNSHGTLTSSLSLSGRNSDQLLDSLNYKMGVGTACGQADTTPALVGDEHMTGYSLINHEALKSADAAVAEGPCDSEEYHQLPSAFTTEAKKTNEPQPNGQISVVETEDRSTTMAAPPSARRHNSANEAYTSIDPSTVKDSNLYSFAIVSTDDRYVSEQGHVYQVLERSDEHQQNRYSSNGGGPKFRILEKGSVAKAGQAIPPYGQVTKSPKQAQKRPKEVDESEHSGSFSQDSNEGSNESQRTIPTYAQVDKSKKKRKTNIQTQVVEQKPPEDPHIYHVLEQSENHDSSHCHVQEQVNEQDIQDTHHYHVLEQSTNENTEVSDSNEGGPIYHIAN